MELLESCGSLTEDMLRHPEPWKRLGERLHPGEHQARFPRVVTAFDTLRNDRPFPTFRRRVEGARYLEHISYTNLKSERYRAAHSGDIVTP